MPIIYPPIIECPKCKETKTLYAEYDYLKTRTNLHEFIFEKLIVNKDFMGKQHAYTLLLTEVYCKNCDFRIKMKDICNI